MKEHQNTKITLTHFLATGIPLIKSPAYVLQQTDETLGDNVHNEETPFLTEKAN